MFEPIQILTAERDGEDGLLVTFSDGTIAGYVAEELLELRPFREPISALRTAPGIVSGTPHPLPSLLRSPAFDDPRKSARLPGGVRVHGSFLHL